MLSVTGTLKKRIKLCRTVTYIPVKIKMIKKWLLKCLLKYLWWWNICYTLIYCYEKCRIARLVVEPGSESCKTGFTAIHAIYIIDWKDTTKKKFYGDPILQYTLPSFIKRGVFGVQIYILIQIWPLWNRWIFFLILSEAFQISNMALSEMIENSKN
jgi:hypothetical protein